jgi:hypothetical protein
MQPETQQQALTRTAKRALETMPLEELVRRLKAHRQRMENRRCSR